MAVAYLRGGGAIPPLPPWLVVGFAEFWALLGLEVVAGRELSATPTRPEFEFFDISTPLYVFGLLGLPSE